MLESCRRCRRTARTESPAGLGAAGPTPVTDHRCQAHYLGRSSRRGHGATRATRGVARGAVESHDVGSLTETTRRSLPSPIARRCSSRRRVRTPTERSTRPMCPHPTAPSSTHPASWRAGRSNGPRRSSRHTDTRTHGFQHQRRWRTCDSRPRFTRCPVDCRDPSPCPSRATSGGLRCRWPSSSGKVGHL